MREVGFGRADVVYEDCWEENGYKERKRECPERVLMSSAWLDGATGKAIGTRHGAKRKFQRTYTGGGDAVSVR